MRFSGIVCGAVVALTMSVTSAAQAAIINISGSYAATQVPSFYEANFDFALPTGFSNAVLNITQLTVDDRGVLQLNGTNVDAAAIPYFFGSYFDYNDGAGSVPFTYTTYNGVRNIFVTSGFLAGNNMLRLLVNDTNAGESGVLVNGPGGPSSTTSYSFAATVTYDLQEVPVGVPEPAAWALMIMGFGGIGAAMRNNRRKMIAA